MRMAGFMLHRIAFSTGSMGGRLTRFIVNRVHGEPSSPTSLTYSHSHTGSLYLPLGRLLIRL
jgi:hypothetical protein